MTDQLSTKLWPLRLGEKQLFKLSNTILHTYDLRSDRWVNLRPSEDQQDDEHWIFLWLLSPESL